MGRSQRNKGLGYERHIAHRFIEEGFEDAKRHLESQHQEAGQGRDLDGTAPFAVQCKHWNGAPPITKIDEIVPSEEYPIRTAILKRSMKKGVSGIEVAVIDIDVFFAIIRLLKRNGLVSQLLQELGHGNDI